MKRTFGRRINEWLLRDTLKLIAFHAGR